jgi:hypothetical protein
VVSFVDEMANELEDFVEDFLNLMEAAQLI